MASEGVKSQPSIGAKLTGSSKLTGLFAYNDQRKQTNRDRLLIAATNLFCSKGYAAVSVEDITSEAGVSRVTFYRHFPSKAAVALELFQRAGEIAGPRLTAIGARDFRDRATVVQWLADFFELNREMRGIVRVLSQANVVEDNFSAEVRPYIFDMITALGRTIPAFAAAPDDPDGGKRYVRAWLLLYTILDQSNHAVTTESVSAHPQMIEILADSFLEFVSSSETAD